MLGSARAQLKRGSDREVRLNTLRSQARQLLLQSEVENKLAGVRALWRAWQAGLVAMDADAELAAVGMPGRPERPQLVPGSRVPKRGFASRQGRAALMHAIAHIEFNAINLALDAICRFVSMPKDYYADWLKVAAEEAYHFELVRAHLRHLGFDYGDFPAHAGLWDMCEKTAGDVLERMALVPRVLEARGLDVTPEIQKKLRDAGDAHAARILDVIIDDEIGHVAIGNRWYRHVCQQRGLDPLPTFKELLARHYPRGLFGPFNLDARRQAGFSAAELELLQA